MNPEIFSRYDEQFSSYFHVSDPDCLNAAFSVIPAYAGIQNQASWIPAYAGMTNIDLPLYLLPPNPMPLIEYAYEIAKYSGGYDGILGIGSGVINDLCKFAGYIAGKPTAIYATALSMNGYASATSSLIVDRVKKSIQSKMHEAIIFDYELLARTPKRLNAAGIGDSLARITAQRDYILYCHMNNIPYDEGIFSRQIAHEQAAFSGDLQALAMLLYYSGLAMSESGSSAPASGGEHSIAHILDDGDFLHGEYVSVSVIYYDLWQQENLHLLERVRDFDFQKLMKVPDLPNAPLEIAKRFGLPLALEDIAKAGLQWEEILQQARNYRSRESMLVL